MASVPSPGPSLGRSRDLRRSWRNWRRSRPFWGGLLLALGGLELIAIPLSGVLAHGAIKLTIYVGIGGDFGVLIGVLLIACGAVVCANPQHRTFYGVAGVVLGILSFPASNLGGFVIGMLLAIAGGSIAFAWAPVEQPPVTAPPAPESSDGEPSESDGPAESDESAEARLPRRMAIAAMPLLLAAGLLGSPGASASAATPQQTCILWIFCFPSPSPSPAPTPSPSVSPSPGSTGGILPGLPGTSPSPSASPSPSPSASPGAEKHTSGTPGLVAATATSVIKAGSAELTDFAYQGAASLPTATGSVQEMKFTAGALTLSGGVTATVSQGGATTTTASSALDFDGSVVLYATQLSGCEGPLCVTLTPADVLTELLKLLGPVTSHVSLTLTSVTTDQPLVTAASLATSGLTINVG
jgi:hypothetical protein